MPRAFQLRNEIGMNEEQRAYSRGRVGLLGPAGAMYIHKPIPVYPELEPWPARILHDRGLPRLSALT